MRGDINLISSSCLSFYICINVKNKENLSSSRALFKSDTRGLVKVIAIKLFLLLIVTLASLFILKYLDVYLVMKSKYGSYTITYLIL